MSTENDNAPPVTDVSSAISRLDDSTLLSQREKMATDRQDVTAFDADIARRGLTVPDRHRAADFRQHGMAERSTAADYQHAQFNPQASINADGRGQLANLAASLNLAQPEGQSLMARVSDVVARLDSMPRENWENWAAESDRVTMRIAGSKEEYDKVVGLAKDALTRSGSDVAKKLSEHVALKDPVLLRQLANAQQAWLRLNGRYKPDGSKK